MGAQQQQLSPDVVSELVTIPQAARMLAASYWLVHRLMKDGDLPTVNVARRGSSRRSLRIPRKAVLEYISADRRTA